MIGIICGAGDLPKVIIEELKRRSKTFVCLGFSEQEPHFFKDSSIVSEVIGLGEIEKALHFLKKNQVTQIVFAGSIKRPNILSLRLDALGKKWLKKIGLSVFKGDDGLLRSLIGLLEEEGFEIISAKDIASCLFLEKGLYGVSSLSEDDMRDVQKGIDILNHLSAYDIGQSIIVEKGQILGIEAVEGTQFLIERIKSFKKAQNSGVLVKMCKKNQTQKADLPTIGVETIQQCYNSGLVGIAIDGKLTQVIGKENVLEEINKNKMFLYVF